MALSFFCTRFFLPLKWHFLSLPLTFPFWNFSRSKTSFARGADSCSLHRLLIYDAYLIILLTDGHGRVCSNIVFWLLAFLKLAKSWKALCPGHPNCQIWKPPPNPCPSDFSMTLWPWIQSHSFGKPSVSWLLRQSHANSLSTIAALSWDFPWSSLLPIFPSVFFPSAVS